MQTTALALRALWHYRHSFSIQSNLTTARQFLLDQRDSTTAQWGEPFETALALLAVIPQLPDLTLVQPSIDALAARQRANGSWQDDAYTTALTLQALHLANTPQFNPDFAAVQGRVIDAGTGLPLAGVTVDLAGATINQHVTASDGRFRFDQLVTGDYNLTLSLAGYVPLSAATRLPRGQTVDFATLTLVKRGSSTLGQVQGRVLDAVSGQPLTGAAVTVSGVSNPVLTDTQGVYLVAGVPAGEINVAVTAANYAPASAILTLAPGGTVVFSPALHQGVAGIGGLQGRIVDGLTGAPLSGASVRVSVPSAPLAFTDADGTYELFGLPLGALTVNVSHAGYAPVQLRVFLLSGLVAFSPKLYPPDRVPFGANTAGLSGVVLDAGSNQPLAGVAVTAVAEGDTRSVVTDTQGRFALTGFTETQLQVRFEIGGYVTSAMDVLLNPLSLLDAGQVRMRRRLAERLLPDLTATLKASSVTTDPQTLQLTGALNVQIQNRGSGEATAPIQVLAFFDANANGRYDADTDPRLGAAGTEPLSIGGSRVLSLPVQGTLPFRDAPISVWVDSGQNIIELDETNNVGATTGLCEVQPALSSLEPVLKWAWTGSPVLPNHRDAGVPPIVAQTNDDNHDGKIDANDIPDVIFVAFNNAEAVTTGVLRILSGKDGSELVTVDDPANRLHWYSTPAVGDIDGDGQIEIIVSRLQGGLVALEHDGTFKWRNLSPALAGRFGGAAIADLDSDGKPEIIFGKTVLNADGTLRWDGAGSFYGGSAANVLITSVVADLDLSPGLEVIAGASAYDHSGKLLWQNDTVGDGYVGIGNFNDDPYPEIAVVANGRVYLLDHQGAIIWGPVLLPGGGHGGPPTIADLDGDGKPEIGVAGAGRYVVFSADGSILWSSPTQDFSSHITGSSAFDFEGDGQAEVVYADEVTVRIYRGSTGEVLVALPHSSGTGNEYPVIADVDNDGHADLLVASNMFFGSRAVNGIRVFQNKHNAWTDTRKIWNQHSYHVDNINDDGSIPRAEAPSWQGHNTYRLNAFIGRASNAVPDLSASLLKVLDRGAGAPLMLSLRVGNGGALAAPATAVAFYQGDPTQGGRLLGTLPVAALAPGSYQDLMLDNVAVAGADDLYALVDPLNQVSECSKGNNRLQIPLVPATGVGSLSVMTDALLYPPQSLVQLKARITNTGRLTADYSVVLRVEDTAGNAVAEFPAFPFSALPMEASATVSQVWDTGATIAGTYSLRGLLYDRNGQRIQETRSAFSIQHPAASGPAASLQLTTDRPVYHTTDTVFLQSLVRNLTTSTLLPPTLLNLAVTDASGREIFRQTTPVGQLAPGALRALPTPVALNGATVAVYSVQGQLHDGGGTLLASAQARFEVRFNLAQSLTGTLSVARAVLQSGETQTCTDELVLRGGVAVQGLEVHRALTRLDVPGLISETVTTEDLLPGAHRSQVRGFSTQDLPAGDYACLLQAKIDNTLTTLGFAAFKLNQAPIKIDAQLRVAGRGRLLVLLDAPKACAPDSEYKDGGYKNANENGGDRSEGRGCSDADRDPHGPYGSNGAPSLSSQRAFLTHLLDAADWSYTLTDSAEAFTRELRTGGYAVYALFAEQAKLSYAAQKELREAVFRGAGLVVAGVHDSRHHDLAPALGLKLIGQVTQATRVLLNASSLGLSGELALLAGDQALRIQRTSAASLGVYRLGAANDSATSEDGRDCRDHDADYRRRHPDAYDRERAQDRARDNNHGGGDSESDGREDDAERDVCDGHPERYLDALTLNRYGQGQGAFAGFDLLATAAYLDVASDHRAAQLLLQLLQSTHPATLPAYTGRVLPFQLQLQNQGVATPVRASVTLPADTLLLAAPNAVLQGRQLLWDSDLALGQSRVLPFWLRLPATPGAIILPALIEAPQAGTYRVYAAPSLRVTVEPAP